jgi:hypothetical protein
MVEQHNNSVIFRDVVDDNNLIDFSYIGMHGTEEQTVSLTELDNGFLLGDAIYYDYKTNHYRRALAMNQIMSEVIGVVSKIIDKDSFELTLKGSIILDRYSSIPLNTPLYLSQNISGKLVQDEPTIVSKIIGVTTNDGIYVNIQRGYFVGFGPQVFFASAEPYLFVSSDNKLFKTTDNMRDNANYEPKDKLRYYTSQEIQDLITRIKNDIY